MSLLQVDALDQFYGGFQALFGVSLEVAEGEIVAIIGANGAGKSTFLKTVAGLLRSHAGAVQFDGQPIGDRSAHRRVRMGIAMVPEGRRVFTSLSVDENLRVGGFGKRPGWWNVGRVYELFPLLGKLSNRQAGVLSGGEQQALAIGRALMANPKVLLMDEISLGLAPIVVKQLYQAIPEIVDAGATLVIVEQDITQALRIAQRAYCFLEGRVSMHGRPADLTRDQVRSAYFGLS
jgi:branched-chain amino acid transport system ATP-binding protein